MGTPVAWAQATLYYADKEETIIPKYQHPNGPLLFYARLIDDTFQVWDTALLPDGMTLYNFRPQYRQQCSSAFWIGRWIHHLEKLTS